MTANRLERRSQFSNYGFVPPSRKDSQRCPALTSAATHLLVARRSPVPPHGLGGASPRRPAQAVTCPGPAVVGRLLGGVLGLVPGQEDR